MSNIFKIKGRVSSQFNISKDPLEQFNIKYLNEFASFGSIGNLTTGSAPAFIDNFNSKTFVVTATVQNYDPKLDIIEWTQVSGASVTFSAPNSLVTLVTTAASNPTDVVLQCTATRVSGSEVDSSSDTLNITASPVDITSSNVIKLQSNFDNQGLYNPSWVGSDDQTLEGNIDVIFWNVPRTRKNYSYVGYKLQAFNKTFNAWYDIQTGDAQSDVGSYRITDYTLIYRYLPIWKGRFDTRTPVVGTSTPILKAINTGVNATSFGLFETLEQGAGLFSKVSSPSVNRFAISIESISETDNFKHESIIRNALDEVSANRYLSTLTEITESDSLSEKTKLSSNVHSLSVARQSGVSLGEIGN